ncbi:MAG: DUF3467 domain-containing protein [Thermoguttaceae bacterium]|jgi:hypothetical protein
MARDRERSRAREPQREAPAAENPVRIQVEDSNVVPVYANFCRVTGAPEELIVDFGLNPQPMGAPTEPIPVNHRIVLNFYTAKRLYHALGMTIQRHEAAFGTIEVDVNKRAQQHRE